MKKTLMTVLIMTMIFTTGCWDMIELEDRLLPYSVAMELCKDAEEENKTFFVCFSYPNINGLGKDATQDDLAYMVSANANSIFDATKQLSSRVHNSIFLKHLNVLILSEDVFSNEKYMLEILDGLQRDFIVNKMINILLTEGSSHELLLDKFDSERQETVDGLFISLLKNEQKSNKFTPITLMEFIQDMDHRKAAVVPLAIPGEEIRISGGGLFKDYQFVGYIDEIDNRNISLLNNDLKNGELDLDFNGNNLSLSLDDIKSKKKLIKDQDMIKIKYDMELDGQLHQFTLDKSVEKDTQEVISDMERTVEDYILSELSSTIEKLQKDFNADALGILEYLYKFHPKIHKELEEDWDSIFPNLEIDVDVKLNIRRRGLSEG